MKSSYIDKNNISPELINRFHNKLLKTDSGCWSWVGSFNNSCPILTYKQHTYYAKNLAFYLKTGRCENVLVGTSCRNNSCLNPEHLYDRREYKICYKCNNLLDVDKFGFRKGGRNLRGACKNCEAKNKKDWATRNPNKVILLNRISGLRRRGINITLDEYNILLKRQEHKCAICGASSGNSVESKLFIDHDHNTGIIRGLLCGKCNSGLGMFNDNLSLILKASEYLRIQQTISTSK